MQSGSPLVGQNKNSQSRNLILSFFNSGFKSLTYGKAVRASFLLLFIISIIMCLFSPGLQTGLAAILSLVAFVSFDVMCFFHKKTNIVDHSEDIAALKNRNAKLEQEFQAIKDEASIANIGIAFGKKR